MEFYWFSPLCENTIRLLAIETVNRESVSRETIVGSGIELKKCLPNRQSGKAMVVMLRQRFAASDR